MQKWEYLVLRMSFHGNKARVTSNGTRLFEEIGVEKYEAFMEAFHNHLNSLGAQGWELHNTALDEEGETYFLKRPIE